MLTLKDVRQYISGLQITADDQVHIGKLDNKKEKSIMELKEFPSWYTGAAVLPIRRLRLLHYMKNY